MQTTTITRNAFRSSTGAGALFADGPVVAERSRGTAIARARSRIRGLEIGRVRVNLAAGEIRTIRLRLTPAAIRMVRRGSVRYALTLRTPV